MGRRVLRFAIREGGPVPLVAGVVVAKVSRLISPSKLKKGRFRRPFFLLHKIPYVLLLALVISVLPLLFSQSRAWMLLTASCWSFLRNRPIVNHKPFSIRNFDRLFCTGVVYVTFVLCKRRLVIKLFARRLRQFFIRNLFQQLRKFVSCPVNQCGKCIRGPRGENHAGRNWFQIPEF